MKKGKLIHLQYVDEANAIQLKGYSDCLVWEPSENPAQNTLIAARIAGQPNFVQAIATVLCGGGNIQAVCDEHQIVLRGNNGGYEKVSSKNENSQEIILYPKDDDGLMKSADEIGKEPAEQKRVHYLFSSVGDWEHLFSLMDQRSFVPLIPEFKDYLLRECIRTGVLKKMSILSLGPRFECWKLILTEGDKNLIAIVEHGLQSKLISIPGSNPGSEMPRLAEIGSLSKYLNTFGKSLADQIKESYHPLFDPETEMISPQLKRVNEFIHDKTGYYLYPAQLSAAQGAQKALASKRPAIIVAECGSGKTKIGAAATYACYASEGISKAFCVVLCPSHMLKKWQREILETVPKASAVIIRQIRELQEAYRIFETGSQSVFVILSKEKARDGYQRAPAVLWSDSRKGFLCPDCGKTIPMPIGGEDSSCFIPADPSFFLKETRQNHRCPNCGTVLWAPTANRDTENGWAKVSGLGFVCRRIISDYFSLATSTEMRERLECLNSGVLSRCIAARRYPISLYIRKKMKGKVNTFLCDELHNYNQHSGQGDAMYDIYTVSRHFVGLTATLVNGYASGIFHLLYRLTPSRMQIDHQDYFKPQKFSHEYGVTQMVYRESRKEEYSANRRKPIRKIGEKQLPGISPLVYTRFLIENAIFLSLSDMGKQLPEYEEIPVCLNLAPAVKEEYERIQNTFVQVMKKDFGLRNRLQSSFISLLTAYADQPYGQHAILSPDDGTPLIIPRNIATAADKSEKDLKTLEIIKRKRLSGEKVLVYTSWTRLDTQKKLGDFLNEEGIRCCTLTTAVVPQKREEWLEQRLAEGIDVLITNPTLVETGLDLNSFTTLIFYNINYNLFTLRQSSRRSWRINQSAQE